MQILQDDKEFHFQHKDYPILISGQEGTGSSFFSVMLAVDAFRQGSKVLFCSAFPMAKEILEKELSSGEKADVGFIHAGEAFDSKRMLVVASGEESVLIDSLDRVPDLQERIVLIKNMDSYSPALFGKVKLVPGLILSGDLDLTPFASQIDLEKFPSKVFFSWPEAYINREHLAPQKYEGILIQGNTQTTLHITP